jgi:hypothetical protein
VIADVVLDDGEGRELLPAGRGLELPACAPNEHLECQGLALAGAIAVSSSRPSFSAQYRAVRVGALELACNEPVGDVPHGCVAVEFDDLRETHPDSAWLVFGSNDVLWLGLPEGTTMRYTQIGTRTSRIASD